MCLSNKKSHATLGTTASSLILPEFRLEFNGMVFEKTQIISKERYSIKRLIQHSVCSCLRAHFSLYLNLIAILSVSLPN
jgi:hypothetical protein